MNNRTTLVLLLGCACACGGATTPINAGTDGGTPPRARGPTGSVVADGGSGPGVEAHPGGTTSSLPCGSATCMIPAESCCVIDMGSGPSYSCIVGPSCPSPNGMGNPSSGTGNNTGATGNNAGTGNNSGTMDTTVVTLQCAGAANCPQGTVCCAASMDNATSSTCKPACNANETQLCDPMAAVSSCPTMQPCTTRNTSDLGLASSFGTCGQGGATN